MLEDANVEVRLIDFGCATWEGGPPGSLVQTVQYRAPEVCVGLDWTFPCDMWSVGCIILELFEGDRVFDISGMTGSIPQHLAMMQQLTGLALPRHMIQRASSDLLYCTDRRNGCLLWPQVSGGDLMRDRCVDRELEVLRVVTLSQRINHPMLYQMRDFLSAVMQLDPDLRITPSAALNCEWCVSLAAPLPRPPLPPRFLSRSLNTFHVS
jgi:dual-specificity kinase